MPQDGSLMWARGPIWSSGFRPFYLLGALYAPVLMAGVGGALGGLVDLSGAGSAAHLWHGHEMLFGFAGAIIVGTLLTALPSWAGTPEVQGRALALLVALWLLGRLAFWASPWLPWPLTALADGSLLVVLCIMLAPALWRVPNRLYRLLLPIVLALALANTMHLAGMLAHDPPLALAGLHAGVYAVMVLYLLLGGLLTSTFTGNALRLMRKRRAAPKFSCTPSGGQAKPGLGALMRKRRAAPKFSCTPSGGLAKPGLGALTGGGDQARALPALEVLATASLLLLAASDLLGAPPAWTGTLALACAVLVGMRTLRWRGWRALDDGLLWPMHLGFVWLVLAFVLKAIASLGGDVPHNAWLHAFTIGALGQMMLALMTRVALRHTGRPLAAPRWLRWACAALLAAAALRLCASLWGLGNWAIAVAAALWATPFAVYAAVLAPALIRPSLPRREG